MDAFKITGPVKLKGEIQPQGAKNEALQVIAAVLLTSEKVVIRNVPEILDVQRQIELLKLLGVKVSHPEKGVYEFIASDVSPEKLLTPEFIKLSQVIRGSVMFTGPFLSRFKKMILTKPGGDKIGRRRLDTHFLGFEKLGARFDFNPHNSMFTIDADKLRGTFMHLDEPSVTGTANIIMAAVLAKGKTIIYNAACEPYIQQLCKMLNAMGAKISGVGTNMLVIKGVDSLGGCEHTCLPDMIEIGSFIGMAAITGSSIRIKDAQLKHLGIIPATFNRLGITISAKGNDLYIPEHDIYEIEKQIDGSIPTIYDGPWPGFTSDLISIILVTSIFAKGNILIHQKMFESRLFFVDNLIDMGAQIILCDPHRATVMGNARQWPLRAIKMRSPDIRAGVALVLAAMAAEGISTIYNIEQIDRGYQDIDLRLNALGAKIRRYSENSI